MSDQGTWRELAARLVETLWARGDLRNEVWREAIASTPRHVFVPRFFVSHPESGYRAVGTGDEGWLELVYSNEALITQFDGEPEVWERVRADRDYTPERDDGLIGALPSASSSAPGLMSRMLESLDPGEDDRVLEVGTGSGYNAAVLCHRLGDRNVTTVDIDPELVPGARDRLAQLGYRPSIEVADVTDAVPDGPYDRVIVTVGLPGISRSLISATRPGGVVLGSLSTRLVNHAVFRLTVADDGEASGKVSMGARFMPVRERPIPHSFDLLMRIGELSGVKSPTEFDPSTLDDWSGFAVFAGLRTRDLMTGPFGSPARPGDYWLVDSAGSWAFREREDDTTYVVQGGPRRLWTDAERLWDAWRDLGEPPPDRFGLTVGSRGEHTLWLDDPDGDRRWILPGPRG